MAVVTYGAKPQVVMNLGQATSAGAATAIIQSKVNLLGGATNTGAALSFAIDNVLMKNKRDASQVGIMFRAACL